MRRRLLAAASMIVLAGAPAFADEEINNERTSPVRTSTSGDILITSSGRVRLTDNPGPAVVIDSDNTLEIEPSGLIAVNDQSGAVGVFAEGGYDSGIVHRGTIQLTDSDNRQATPIADPISSITDETDKVGILVGAPGDAAFRGDILVDLAGNIGVIGQNSYGIRTIAPVEGNITINGQVVMVGEHSRAISIEGGLVGDFVTGNSSQIRSEGQGSSAIVFEGDVQGAVRIGAPVVANGFRITDRTIKEFFLELSNREAGEVAEDTRLGGSAIVIMGTIRDGVFIGNTSNTQPTISATGSAPAIHIQPGENATGPINFGEVQLTEVDEDGNPETVGSGFGFVNRGNVQGTGVFDGIDATGILIAGRDANGDIQAVILAAGGFQNSGLVAGLAFDGHAEALRIGEGVQSQTITNTGQIIASANLGFSDDGFADSRHGAGSSIAVRIDAGADVARIENSGSIRGQIVGGGNSATAIRIDSNSLTSINNTGTIEAILSNIETDQAISTVAVDARAMTSGLTINQTQSTAENAAAPVIRGDVLLGSGDDVVSLHAGSLIGTLDFGAGADHLSMRGGALFSGSLVSGDGNLTIDAEDSTLELRLDAPLDITSARFGNGSVLNLVLDNNTSAAATLVASGAIDFEAGSELVVSLSELIGAGLTFQVLSAGTLNIAEEDVILETVETPFLYNASLERDPNDSNALVLSLTRKTATEAGLDANRAAVYDAAITLFEDVTSLGNAIASIRDADSFYRAYDQLLPEYAASAIQFALAAHDAAAGALSTRLRNARLSPDQLAGIWIQEFGYFADRAETTFGPGYRGQGVGLAVGLDRPWGPFYAVGVTLAGAASDIEQVGLPHEPMTALMGQFSAYAAADVGLLDVSFTASAGINRFETNRLIQIGNFGGNTTASWSGWHYSAAVQAGRDITLGDWILRPELALTWLSITEDGFNEVAQGNTPADLALYVDSRTTSALTGGATFTVGRMYRRAGSWWLPYARVGYRGDFSGSTATTTARFGENGTPFTLRASEMPGAGILAGLGLSAGSEYTTFTLAYDADMRDEYIAHVLRLVLRMNF